MAPYSFPNKAQHKCLPVILKNTLHVPKPGSGREEFWWWSSSKGWI